MAEPQTVNVGIIVPLTGDLVGIWGSAAVNPDFVAIDGYLGGIQTISLSNIPVTLTSPAAFIPTPSGGPTQAQNGVLRLTGALTGNVQITLPLPGYLIIENLTTGAFVVSFRAVGSGQIIATQQGSCRHIYNDGTNVRFVNLPDVGTYLDVAATAPPAWIGACTIPPYLNCDGTTFNAATYPFLNAFLGGNTLPDLRGVARYSLNQGTGRLTSAVSGLDGNTIFSLKATQSYTLLTINMPPYTPTGNFTGSQLAKVGISTGFSGGGATQALVPNGSGNQANDNTTAIPVVIGTFAFLGNPEGGTSTPFGTVGPGTISGITMIRAG